MARRHLYGNGTVAHYYSARGEKKAIIILSQRKQERCRDSKRGHTLRNRVNDELPTRGRSFTRICTKCGASSE